MRMFAHSLHSFRLRGHSANFIGARHTRGPVSVNWMVPRMRANSPGPFHRSTFATSFWIYRIISKRLGNLRSLDEGNSIGGFGILSEYVELVVAWGEATLWHAPSKPGHSGVGDGGSQYCMSIIRNGNVALTNFIKLLSHVTKA